jgi:NADH oxidase (H2O2-forming)
LTNTSKLSFKPVVNAVVSNVGNINYASCGVTESFADMMGIPVISEYLDSYQKARYYPNNNKLFIKMILKTDGTIVGCQMLSKEDLSSKIDLMSFIITHDLKCEDLINMEFSYTPTYAKVINPLHEMALNIKKKNKV